MSNRLHVVPHDQGGWAIKRENTRGVESTHPTQKEAINAAKDFADREEEVEIVIHRTDGTIRDYLTYEGNGTSDGSRVARVQPQDLFSVGSRISWGAVFAGAVIAMTVYLTFSVLAVATGLSVSNNVSQETFNVGAAICAVFLALVSMFLGGYVVSRTTAGESTAEAVVYGLVLWGVLAIGFAVLASIGVGVGADRITFAPGETTPAQPSVPAQVAEGANLTPEQHEKINAMLAERAQDARNTNAATAAWWTFFGMLLSMGAAVVGSLVGAGPNLYFVRRPPTDVPATTTPSTNTVTTKS